MNYYTKLKELLKQASNQHGFREAAQTMTLNLVIFVIANDRIDVKALG